MRLFESIHEYILFGFGLNSWVKNYNKIILIIIRYPEYVGRLLDCIANTSTRVFH